MAKKQRDNAEIGRNFRAQYPKNWREISDRIRFERAGGRCECRGECGEVHDGPGDEYRCQSRHGETHPITGGKVILTTAHLDHNPENCADENLKAFCHKCHNRYDGTMRRAKGDGPTQADEPKVVEIIAAPEKVSNPVGRPEHSPTADLREIVKSMSGHGMPQDQIAIHIGVAPQTLRKHYRAELDTGPIIANSRMSARMYETAMGRPAEYDAEGRLIRAEAPPNPAMMIWWSKCRMGWKEEIHHKHGGDKDAPPIKHEVGPLDAIAGRVSSIRQRLGGEGDPGPNETGPVEDAGMDVGVLGAAEATPAAGGLGDVDASGGPGVREDADGNVVDASAGDGVSGPVGGPGGPESG